MSIPLDRLYHYIESIAKEIDKNILIYRFWPHGSKKIENLIPLEGDLSWVKTSTSLIITCHDQEPLTYGLVEPNLSENLTKILNSLSLLDLTLHNLQKVSNRYQKTCLLHSEKRSEQVINYQNNRCIPVYYWSHAIISLDWFRYAKYIAQKKQVCKIFLIYNRAWAGTREYRLRFAELLILRNLHNYCQITVNPVEPELDIHYNIHHFENSAWRPQTVLENYFPISDAHSSYSADFNIEDYEATDIEVVLETLFDDDRLHLTEKSLRPIACAQPFILAGTHGSLEYLRSYGFQTFGHVWDESYDLIEDPQERMYAVTDLMKSIADWPADTRKQKMLQACKIADYNRQYFFSQEFFNLITTELKNNLTAGITEINSNPDFQPFIDQWNYRLNFEEIREILKNPTNHHPGTPTIDQVNLVLDTLKTCP